MTFLVFHACVILCWLVGKLFERQPEVIGQFLKCLAYLVVLALIWALPVWTVWSVILHVLRAS